VFIEVLRKTNYLNEDWETYGSLANIFPHKPVNMPLIISNQMTPFLIELSHL